MISFDEALAIIAAQARPLDIDVVPLAQAAGRVLATDCVAQVNAPPSDVSAMDGYALRDEDLIRSMPFRVIGASYPGSAFEGRVSSLECVRIFTGAPIPAGADRVVIQEEIRRDADLAIVLDPSLAKRHIRAKGLDFCVGDVLLRSGRLLDARALVAAAGADLAALHVWRRPRVVVLSTGDELVAPGEARTRELTIPESGSFGVAAMAQAWGADVIDRQRVRDDIDAMKRAALGAIETCDLVVMTGGASVGEKDYAKRVWKELGTDILFSKVAIMPGKPVWFGRRGDVLVLGLPGNPSSAMVTARLFLTGLIAGMTGRSMADSLAWRSVALAEPLPKVGDRETFVRASMNERGVVAVANQDSGMQLALADATLLVRRRPQSPPLEPGDLVEVIAF